MKKLVLVFLFLSLHLVGFGQTEKGKVLLSGMIDLANSSIRGSSQTRFNATPQVGFFAVDNLALGLGVGFKYEPIGITMNGNYLYQTTYGILPFARYYFLSGKIKPFLQAQGGYVSTSQENGFGGSFSSSGFGIAGQGGAAFFLSESVSLDLGLSYGMTSTSSSGSSTSSTVNTLGVNVGFSVYLGK